MRSHPTTPAFVDVAINRVWQSLFICGGPGGAGHLHLSAGLARHADSDGDDSGSADWCFRRHVSAGLFHQTPSPCFSLTLATGLVVDDTIVVLENIDRHIEEEGMPPFDAAKLGVVEVVFAVIATTLVLVAVFLPVGFATGTTGRLFTEFALTLAGAVGAVLPS